MNSASVWRLLEERGIVEWLPREAIFQDENGPFLSGLFGVPKSGRFDREGRQILRLNNEPQANKPDPAHLGWRHPRPTYGLSVVSNEAGLHGEAEHIPRGYAFSLLSLLDATMLAPVFRL